MNISILDSMIRPLSQDRQSQRQDEDECKRTVSSQSEDRLPPMQPLSIVSSQSIPISNIRRTASEIQLHEDEAMADYRDYCFFARLVNGMNGRRDKSYDHYRRDTDQSLANIIRTRNLPAEDSSSAQAGSNNTGPVKQRQAFLRGMEIDDDQEEIFVLDM